MQIDQAQSIGPIRPQSIKTFETDEVQAQPSTFGEMLKNSLDKVNGLQISADDQQLKLALGEISDVHEVMIAMEKASLALQLTIDIRDRVMEAYQTIMRTAM